MGMRRKQLNLNPQGSGHHAKASREAIKAYAKAIMLVEPELAIELTTWVTYEELMHEKGLNI